MILSFRRPSGDPVLEAFADLTHAWLADVRRIAEHEGIPFATGTGAGVLVASDVLVELHGREASWDKLDIDALERWMIVHGDAHLAMMFPLVIADLAVFTHYLALLGRLPDPIANDAHDRVEQMIAAELAVTRVDAPTSAEPASAASPPAAPNRAARRAAKARARRMH